MFRNLSTFGLPLSGRPSELIEMALSFGFDAMDVDLLDLERQASVYGLEHARRLMVSARLESGMFQLPVDISADEETFAKDLEALPARLDLARDAEAPRAFATLAPASESLSFKDNFELHRTRLDTIGGLLAERGIKLALAVQPEAELRNELPHQFIHTLEGLLGLVAVSHEQVGVVVDPFAMHVAGEPLTMLKDVPSEKFIELRVSDAPAGGDAASLAVADRLLPGETGTINLVELLKATEQAGFDGCVTPWAARKTLAGKGREKIVRAVGERLQKAWAEAGLPEEPRWFMPAQQEPTEDGEPPAPLTPPATPTPASTPA